MELKVNVTQWKIQPVGKLWQIAPQDYLSKNDFGTTNVEISLIEKDGLGQEFVLGLLPHSISALELHFYPGEPVDQKVARKTTDQ
jgi:hypothetical protein